MVDLVESSLDQDQERMGRVLMLSITLSLTSSMTETQTVTTTLVNSCVAGTFTECTTSTEAASSRCSGVCVTLTYVFPGRLNIKTRMQENYSLMPLWPNPMGTVLTSQQSCHPEWSHKGDLMPKPSWRWMGLWEKRCSLEVWLGLSCRWCPPWSLHVVVQQRREDPGLWTLRKKPSHRHPSSLLQKQPRRLTQSPSVLRWTHAPRLGLHSLNPPARRTASSIWS